MGDKNNYYFDYLIKTQKFPQSIYHRAKHKITKEMIEATPKGGKILDAGCGAGDATSHFCSDYNVFGVDEQSEAIEYCKQHYQGNYTKCDLAQLPFSNEYFDVIVFHDTIEHLYHPKNVLRELCRVLKPGGKIVISTINYANPAWWILENTWHRIMGGNCRTFSQDVHPTRYTPKLLLEHGNTFFKLIEMRYEVVKMELFYIGTKS